MLNIGESSPQMQNQKYSSLEDILVSRKEGNDKGYNKFLKTF